MRARVSYTQQFRKEVRIMNANPITQEAAKRIIAANAKKTGGTTEKGTWPAKAQSQADKNAADKK
jgi:hypothetical protein